MILSVVALVLGRTGGVSVALGPATSTAGGGLLPDRPLTGDDVRALRFDTDWRGYRTAEVDAAMDALAARIDDLEDRLDAQGVRPARPVGLVDRPVPADPVDADPYRPDAG